MKHVIHKFFTVFGWSIEIRAQSPEFQDCLKRLQRKAELRMGRSDCFRISYEVACNRYGWDDPELIRVKTFAEFMADEGLPEWMKGDD